MSDIHKYDTKVNTHMNPVMKQYAESGTVDNVGSTSAIRYSLMATDDHGRGLFSIVVWDSFDELGSDSGSD